MATAASSISGPMATSASRPCPTFNWLTAAEKRSTNASMGPRLHQDPVGAYTGLACVAELRVDSTLDGGADVGVLEDDERRVPTQFEREPFHSARALRHQQLAYFSRASEGEHPDGLVRGEHGSHRYRVTVDDVEDPRREPSLRPQFSQGQAGQGARCPATSGTTDSVSAVIMAEIVLLPCQPVRGGGRAA